jgi:hypothetical protein
VRAASTVGLSLLRRSDPGQAEALADVLPLSAGPASPDLRRATALFGRIVAYAQDTDRRYGRAS